MIKKYSPRTIQRITTKVIAYYKQMTVSPSGFRVLFNARQQPHNTTKHIAIEYQLLISLIGSQFIKFILHIDGDAEHPADDVAHTAGNVAHTAGNVANTDRFIVLAQDSRPTGNALVQSIIKSMQLYAVSFQYVGIMPTPQVLSYVTGLSGCCGCIIVTASHNPVGYNGIKFGKTDGAVLNPSDARQLIERCSNFFCSPRQVEHEIARYLTLEDSQSTMMAPQQAACVASQQAYHQSVLNSMESLCPTIQWSRYCATVKRSNAPLIHLCIDYNGSARTNSIDTQLLQQLGVQTVEYGVKTGTMPRPIEPEGAALDFVVSKVLARRRQFPQDTHLGIMVDNDGDRGNIVFYSDKISAVSAIEPQQLFALLTYIALSAHTHSTSTSTTAASAHIVINDATSLRVDHLAAIFGARVIRTEVGEANIVYAMEKLVKQRDTVVIGGEGSNGGSILPPAKVRDPLLVLLYIIHALRYTYTNEKVVGTIAHHSTQHHIELPRQDEDTPIRLNALDSLIATIRPCYTTLVTDANAKLTVSVTNYELMKYHYILSLGAYLETHHVIIEQLQAAALQIICYAATDATKIFGGSIEQFELWTSDLATKHTTSPHHLNRYKGGMRVSLLDVHHDPVAALWWRPSGTEPTIRTLVDYIGSQRSIYNSLLKMQRALLLESYQASHSATVT